MKLKYFLLSIIFLFNFVPINSTLANNSIVVKVGNEIVTSYEIENEIRTILFINKQTLNQENINKTKDLAIKELMRKSIKKSEIKKYNVTNYNISDLEKYILNLAKVFQVNRSSLKKLFNQNNINYDILIDKVKTDLMWNSLIFSLYKNQISINAIEVENEIKLRAEQDLVTKEYKLSEIQFYTTPNNSDIFSKIKKVIKEESFGLAAKKFSISPSADNNGEIGWFSEKSLNSQYTKELLKINKGEYTPPIIISDSSVILKIDDIKATQAENVNLEKIKNEIIKQKKEEKLRLFSRSHFSRTESQIYINFL